jgi:streptogramin lyase
MRSLRQGLIVAALLLARAAAAEPAGLPALQRPFAELVPVASFALGATADWVQLTDQAVWVGAGKPDAVVRIDPRANRIAAYVALPGPACAGLAAGFGHLWVPVCGPRPALARIDLKRNRIDRLLPFSVAAEGGITTSPDSVWLVDDAEGRTLVRLDRQGRRRQSITLPEGSFNPLYHQGVVWVTSVTHGLVSLVDARSGALLGSVAVGPQPRFLTAGDGAVWVLNQGDGSVSRIDAVSHQRAAIIPLGLPGSGGDIAYGAGRLWVTMVGVPLTEVDTATNQPLRQWVGAGGDSLRVAGGDVWLTDYGGGTVARLRP